MRITVRVTPGSKVTAVGGRYGDAEPPVLVVHVQARPVDGKANDAVVRALAEAFALRRDRVRIVAGDSARTKVVEVDGGTGERLRVLLGR